MAPIEPSASKADRPPTEPVRRIQTRTLSLLGVAFLIVAPIGAAVIAPSEPPEPASDPPNVVVILTDDQRWDSVNPNTMPVVSAELADEGVTFSNALVVNPLCCPSRVSILTSQYSHTSLVYGNSGEYGGFNSFHGDSSTIATWLNDAGYHTALIGKYLNTYRMNYVPPGYDRYLAFNPTTSGGEYYEYSLLNGSGVRTWYGSDPEDYSTDVLASAADAFVRSADPGEPIFLMFTPFAPHHPFIPAPEYEDRFSNLEDYRPPSFNEEDVSDKPAWVQARPRFSEAQEEKLARDRKDGYRTLLSVDDAVGTILAALTDTGRLSNSLIIFASDNGKMMGEHRWNDKKVPWEESIRIPLVVRFDRLIGTPFTDSHLVTNLDVAPTIAELAGIEAPGAEGLSLVPILGRHPIAWRTDTLIEHLANEPTDVPTYCAVRNERYTYVRYLDTGEEELYDLSIDRFQLDSKHDDAEYADTLAELRLREAELCTPPPP
jgi:N-acetylglucosamine-6-sulfatase